MESLSINQKINLKSWFKPENNDLYFMRINRTRHLKSNSTQTDTEQPIFPEHVKGFFLTSRFKMLF